MLMKFIAEQLLLQVTLTWLLSVRHVCLDSAAVVIPSVQAYVCCWNRDQLWSEFKVGFIFFAITDVFILATEHIHFNSNRCKHHLHQTVRDVGMRPWLSPWYTITVCDSTHAHLPRQSAAALPQVHTDPCCSLFSGELRPLWTGGGTPRLNLDFRHNLTSWRALQAGLLMAPTTVQPLGFVLCGYNKALWGLHLQGSVTPC